MTSGRFWFGIAVTAAWLSAMGVYMFVKWGEVKLLSPGALGDFAGGSVGPIAFLWLILGYLQQGEDVRQNTEALLAQREEMRQQAEFQDRRLALEETSRHEERARAEPRFEFQQGSRERRSSKLTTDMFTLWNRGASVRDVEIASSGASLTFARGPLDTGKKRGLTINHPPESAPIVVRYTTLLGTEHEEVFTYDQARRSIRAFDPSLEVALAQAAANSKEDDE